MSLIVSEYVSKFHPFSFKESILNQASQQLAAIIVIKRIGKMLKTRTESKTRQYLKDTVERLFLEMNWLL